MTNRLTPIDGFSIFHTFPNLEAQTTVNELEFHPPFSNNNKRTTVGKKK